MKRALQDTPEFMVENGKIKAFGSFAQPFRHNNIMETDVFGIGRLGAKLFNRFRLKEWQHFAIFGTDFLFTFVVLDAHYLGSSFCYFVDRKNGEMIERHRDGLSTVVNLSNELWDARCSFKTPGYSIDIHNNLNNNRHTASINIPGKAGEAGISAELTFHADIEKYQPLEVALRLAPNRPAYSHKMACPASGAIRIADRVINLDPARCIVLIDVHKAFYPYHMTWSWATCAGFDDKGRIVGLNLTKNVIKDDAENNENGLWVGNKLSMFGAVRFDFNEKKLLDPWRIETEDGRCKLTFRPEGERTGSINAGIVSSNYHQPYGIFSGEAIDDSGQKHVIKDFFGVTEFHKARF